LAPDAHRAHIAAMTIAAAMSRLIRVVLSPITLLGYLIWSGSLIRRRGTGVSSTAQGPLSARWFEHVLGTRPDVPTDRLMRVLPGIPASAPLLSAFPSKVAHRLTGYVPYEFRYPFEGEMRPRYEISARMAFFDDVVARHGATARQFVVLGAGFDTRAYRGASDDAIRWFEVDQPKTQAVKRTMLRDAGIDASRITFVTADFEREDWLERLTLAGLDVALPTVFLWEGVTMYLDAGAVAEAFRRIASCAAGSVVAFDYFTTEVLTSKAPYWRFARATTNAAGEPLRFGIDSTPPVEDHVAELLRSCGLTLVEHHTLGRESGSKRAWGGFAMARVAALNARRSAGATSRS
jgi:methyltransferase (TIGR00027 family)